MLTVPFDVKGLDDETLSALSNAVYDEVHERAKKMAKTMPPLNEDEKKWIRENMAGGNNAITAMRSYRDRNKCSLHLAKVVVDEYRYGR